MRMVCGMLALAGLAGAPVVRGTGVAAAAVAGLAMAQAPAKMPAPAPQSPPAADEVGTIIIAHGGGPEWNAQVFELAKQVQTGGPVEVALLMGPAAKDHRFQDIATRMVAAGVRAIVVVPLLISSHSGHYEQIRYIVGETDSLSESMLHHLHMAGIEPASVEVPVRLARAVDDSPEVARVLAERARALAGTPREEALFLVGHGPNAPEDYATWMKNLRVIADTVQALTGFRDVRIGLVQDDAPAPVRAEAVLRARELISLQAAMTGRDVVVVPVLVSQGALTREKLPADLAGLPIRYSGEALLPHPGLARWVEARVREASAEVTPPAR